MERWMREWWTCTDAIETNSWGTIPALIRRDWIKPLKLVRKTHDNRFTHDGEVVSLTRRRPLPPRRFLVLISVRGWVDPRAIVRLLRIRSIEKSKDLIGIRTRDLPACSILKSSTTLEINGLQEIHLKCIYSSGSDTAAVGNIDTSPERWTLWWLR
jgi:hypothetical protein